MEIKRDTGGTERGSGMEISRIYEESELRLHQMYDLIIFYGQTEIADRSIVWTAKMKFGRCRNEERAMIMIIAKIRLIT